MNIPAIDLSPLGVARGPSFSLALRIIVTIINNAIKSEVKRLNTKAQPQAQIRMFDINTAMVDLGKQEIYGYSCGMGDANHEDKFQPEKDSDLSVPASEGDLSIFVKKSHYILGYKIV